MTLEEFELNLIQVHSAIRDCRSSFKVKEHQQAYNSFIELFKAISLRYRNFNYLQLRDCSDKLLLRVYLGIEFLHYNKFSDVPIHLTRCLELALSEWVKNPASFSIVFSHNSSTLKDISTWPFSNETDLNNLCEELRLGVKFRHSLVQISQPRFFKNDFLSAIACYHELGHFIESYYGISIHLLRSAPFEYHASDEILTNANPDHREKIYYYIREHFCDLFAAQYLGYTMSQYLNFIAEDEHDGIEHPSTKKRIEVVKCFVDGTGAVENLSIVEAFKRSAFIQTKRAKYPVELKKRLTLLTKDPFEIDRPVRLGGVQEIHTLFSRGWEQFMHSHDFREKYPDPFQRNQRVNYLIQKCIDLTLFNRSWPTKLRSLWLD